MKFLHCCICVTIKCSTASSTKLKHYCIAGKCVLSDVKKINSAWAADTRRSLFSTEKKQEEELSREQEARTDSELSWTPGSREATGLRFEPPTHLTFLVCLSNQPKVKPASKTKRDNDS